LPALFRPTPILDVLARDEKPMASQRSSQGASRLSKLAVIYSHLHYQRHCNFEVGNAIVALAASLFAVVLNTALLIEIISLDAADLGKLEDEKRNT
jgi:hypothetical protein